MLKLFKYLKARDWIRLAFVVIFTVFNVWLLLTLPEYVQKIVDLVTKPSNVELYGDKLINEVLKAGGIMLLVSVANGACAIIINVFCAKIGADFARVLREQVYAQVMGFSLEELSRFSTAGLITRTTNDIQQICMTLMMGLRMVIMCPIMAVWAVIKVLGESNQLSLATAVAVIILLVAIVGLFILVMPKFKRMQKLVDKVNGVTRENLTGLRVVRAYNAEAYQEEKFEKVNDELTKTYLFVNRSMCLLDPVMNLVMNGLSLVIVWWGSYLINGNALQLGQMTSFTMYAMHVVMSFMMITMVFIMFPRASVSAKRVAQVLDIERSIVDGAGVETDESKRGTVEFSNVCFKYPEAEENVLSDISFTAKKGETVAFIGGTGSGKSTVIKLIPRFYDATEGEVLVDGVNVKEYGLRELRDKLGYVPQKAVLFSGTIAENLIYGDTVATEEEMRSAAAVAKADEFIEQKEDKYESKIAQGGTNVSGGQKQRLSIARAVVRKPEIFIFDDSFSALDYKTDKEVRANLKEKTADATCLIVAQRIGTIMYADKIIVLDDGRIVGEGKHEELLKTCSVYREIAQSQLSQEELEK